MWVSAADLPRGGGHPFYERLNRILEAAGFDAFVEGLCAQFYAAKTGRPGLAPGRYFRLLLIGYFRGRGRGLIEAGSGPPRPRPSGSVSAAAAAASLKQAALDALAADLLIRFRGRGRGLIEARARSPR